MRRVQVPARLLSVVGNPPTGLLILDDERITFREQRSLWDRARWRPARDLVYARDELTQVSREGTALRFVFGTNSSFLVEVSGPAEPWLALPQFGLLARLFRFDLRVDAVDGVASTAAFGVHDVADLVFLAGRELASEPGYSHETFAVVRLRDGRWAYLLAAAVTRTRDLHACVVAATYEALWHGALEEAQRDEVLAHMPAALREEAIVHLDAELESPDPEVRARAEARMQKLLGERRD